MRTFGLALPATLLFGCFSASAPVLPVDQHAPDGVYRVADDPATIASLRDELWTTLAESECWEAPQEPVQCFEFDGHDRYRYTGLDAKAGSLMVESVGWYGRHAAAAVRTWTDDPELIVKIDDQTIAHAVHGPDGAISATTFFASRNCF